MSRNRVIEDGGSWVKVEAKHPKGAQPGYALVSKTDLPRIEGKTVFCTDGGRSYLRIATGVSPNLGAYLHGLKGYVHYYNGDKRDCRQGNVVKCPSRVVSMTGPVYKVDISTKALPGATMSIDAVTWRILLDKGIGKVNAYKHPRRDTVYAITQLNNKSYRVHNLLVGDIPEGMEVDHINRNGSDNRLSNLRVVTRAVNNANRRTPKHNTSKRKGVHFHTCTGKWCARIMVNKKTINCPLRRTYEEAVADRELMEVKYLGGLHHD